MAVAARPAWKKKCPRTRRSRPPATTCGGRSPRNWSRTPPPSARRRSTSSSSTASTSRTTATSVSRPEPLYGEQYLPRKFKVGIAVEGDNCIDVYSDDLGLVAMRGPEGGLRGFNVLVGGGLGRTHNKPDTYPAVAQAMAFVEPEQVVE